jgi:hypothetical protein
VKVGQAVDLLEQGRDVCRTGWNGKGMYLRLQPAVGADPAYVYLVTRGKRVPWTCSQADLLADDWVATDGG